jgi:hypothetical protein
VFAWSAHSLASPRPVLVSHCGVVVSGLAFRGHPPRARRLHSRANGGVPGRRGGRRGVARAPGHRDAAVLHVGCECHSTRCPYAPAARTHRALPRLPPHTLGHPSLVPAVTPQSALVVKGRGGGLCGCSGALTWTTLSVLCLSPPPSSWDCFWGASSIPLCLCVLGVRTSTTIPTLCFPLLVFVWLSFGPGCRSAIFILRTWC